MVVHNIKRLALIYAIAVSAVLSGCSEGNSITDKDGGAENSMDGGTDNTSDDGINLSDIGPDCFSDRDNDASYDAGEAESVDLSDGGVNITDEGTYILSGDMTSGKIVVNAPGKKVQLVFAGCNITSQNSCPFVIEEADKVFMTLADGSMNTVSDAASYTETLGDSTVDAAIFSKADLTINGGGTLNVTGSYKYGIVSKDDITITGGEINVTSVKSGIVGKDCVQIGGGKINVSAGTHAISSTNEEDKSKGYVYVYSGDMSLDAGKKGIKAISGLIVDGGTINVSRSYEGLESTIININGGEIDIVSSDDGINASDMYSDGEEQSEGGRHIKAGKPAGEKPDEEEDVPAGRMSGDRKTSEGERTERDEKMPEGERPDNDGNIHGGGKTDGGMKMPASDSPCDLTINGGTLNINASGDGIDSNGTLCVNGGQIYVSGPSSHGNGALDYNGDAVITGGTVIAAGSAGMAEYFGQSSTQASLLIRTGSQEKGSTIKVIDSSGNEIISWQSPKEYESVIISSPNLIIGSEYVIEAGDYRETVELTELICCT